MNQLRKTLLVRRTLAILGTILFPGVILWSIWYPEIKHHYMPTVTLDPVVVETARLYPADSILDELSEIRYLAIPDKDALVSEAELILAGRFTNPWEGVIDLSVPFDPKDLEQGASSRKLMLAGLTPVNILVEAYWQDGREEFIIAARDMLEAFGNYERTALLPKGFLRNDHATAARIGVLTKFWKAYRQHPSYDPGVAARLLELSYRSGQYLAKPSHFNFRTNHGIMQNIALLQLSLAFSALPEADHFRSLAMERLACQFDYYVSNEGVVLEHSAGYQAEGLRFVATICRLVTLTGQDVPEDWQQKYERGLVFLNLLQREDGSLPLIGDTGTDDYWLVVAEQLADGSYQSPTPYEFARPTIDYGLYPTEGYAIWWDGISTVTPTDHTSQTAVAWSLFPGHGHKQPDEMGVWFWADGFDWWTSSGYWPYGEPEEKIGRSWLTSNAPHMEAEEAMVLHSSYDSPRKTRLLWSGRSERGTVLDLQREGPGLSRVRRQIISLDGSRWIVLDYGLAPEGGQLATAWTADYRLTVAEGAQPGTYILQSPEGHKRLYVTFGGSDRPSITPFTASIEPLLGWQAIAHEAKPTTVIKVAQPADSSWLLATWSFDEPEELPSMNRFNGPEEWGLELPGEDILVQRIENRIELVSAEGTLLSEMILEQAPDVSEERQALHAAVERADREYPFYYSVVESRTKVSIVLLIVILVQELFFLLYRKFVLRFVCLFRVANLACWIAGGWYVLAVYQF